MDGVQDPIAPLAKIPGTNTLDFKEQRLQIHGNLYASFLLVIGDKKLTFEAAGFPSQSAQADVAHNRFQSLPSWVSSKFGRRLHKEQLHPTRAEQSKHLIRYNPRGIFLP